MAIPDFQSIMLPLMQFCRDGREHTTSETADALAATFKLTTDERKALLPSGVQEIFVNRLAWAKSQRMILIMIIPPRRKKHWKMRTKRFSGTSPQNYCNA